MFRFLVNATVLLVFLAGSAYPSSADSNSVDDEENPFLEAAKSLLQDSLAGGQGGSQGAAGLGSVLQSFMQTDGAKSGLGSIVSGLAAAKGSVDPQMIGQIVGMFAGGAASASSNDNNGPGVDWGSMIDLASGMRYTFVSKSSIKTIIVENIIRFRAVYPRSPPIRASP